MPRKQNLENKNTTISVTKHLKLTTIDRLRKPVMKEQGNGRSVGRESDNETLTWVLRQFMAEHPKYIHDPNTTY